MNDFYIDESVCSCVFKEMMPCFHLWTSEKCEVIFRTEDEFRAGMNIIGICAKLFPEIRIITFEVMSNHLHLTVSGAEDTALAYFETIKKFLMRHFRKLGRCIDWTGFNVGIREVLTLEDLRNVIVYNNRNGFVISKGYTPFSYPWGANRYYFCPDSVALAKLLSHQSTQRERQNAINSRIADNIDGLTMFEGSICPLSFCDIASGQKIFRGASHYFNKLGKSIESQKEIAKEISESIFYTDDELFSAITAIARKKYNISSLKEAESMVKLDLARTMKFEYNATAKQIARFLKISETTLSSMGILH